PGAGGKSEAVNGARARVRERVRLPVPAVLGPESRPSRGIRYRSHWWRGRRGRYTEQGFDDRTFKFSAFLGGGMAVVTRQAHASARAGEPIVLADGVRKRSGKITALNGVSIYVMPGETFGLQRANSASESNTM